MMVRSDPKAKEAYDRLQRGHPVYSRAASVHQPAYDHWSGLGHRRDVCFDLSLSARSSGPGGPGSAVI